MLSYDEFSDAVVGAAQADMQDEAWYSGVCCNNLREYYEEYLAGDYDVDNAVESVIGDTMFYDYPWWTGSFGGEE